MTLPSAWTPFGQAPFNETEIMGYYDPTAGQGNYVKGLAGAANVNLYAWSTSLLMPVALTVDASGNLNTNVVFTGAIGTVNQGTGGSSAWKVDGSGVTQPVSGTFWQATQPVSGTVGVKGTDAATIATASNPFNTMEVAQLVQSKFDYISLSNYTTDNQPQTVTYKSGGSGGTTVATLTLVFSNGAAGGNLSSVTKA